MSTAWVGFNLTESSFSPFDLAYMAPSEGMFTFEHTSDFKKKNRYLVDNKNLRWQLRHDFLSHTNKDLIDYHKSINTIMTCPG